MSVPFLSAVVVAAGSSTRMGFDKLSAPLAGKPVLWHSLRAFQLSPVVREIILVKKTGTDIADILSLAEFPKVTQTADGGLTRSDSVLAGLEKTDPASEFVAVHDAARPLVSVEAIRLCFDAAMAEGAALCAEPLTDTLHRVCENGTVRESPPRSALWRAQTPQIFRTQALLHAHKSPGGAEFTDDASLMLQSGVHAKIVADPGWNLKITRPSDLLAAEAHLQYSRQ